MSVSRDFLAALTLACGGALLCVWMDTPLPWMIGPIFTTATACMLGVALHAPVQAREAGQCVVGTTLGLYFTSTVWAVLGSYWGWIVLGAVFALVLGWLGGLLLQRLSGADTATAFFAMSVGGAAEMAVQAERHDARVDQVAAAHSVRILLVVCIIPFALRYVSTNSLELTRTPMAALDLPGLLLLVALSGTGSVLLKRRGVPNAWTIGSLLIAATLTSSGIHLSRVPEWLIKAGQLLIGVSLGTRFTADFLRIAPRYLSSVVASALATMVMAALFGGLMAMLSGVRMDTMILATSPGGIAEMALTARMLHLAVPVITAFHAVRMLAVVLLVGPLYRWINRL